MEVRSTAIWNWWRECRLFGRRAARPWIGCRLCFLLARSDEEEREMKETSQGGQGVAAACQTSVMDQADGGAVTHGQNAGSGGDDAWRDFLFFNPF
jgi:hypothetical protein